MENYGIEKKKTTIFIVLYTTKKQKTENLFNDHQANSCVLFSKQNFL